MDKDLPEIPVEPIPFAHGLIKFDEALARGRAKVVAIGSSTTAGEGNIPAYPGRLLSFLQNAYPKANIAMLNKGIGGEEAPVELQRFDTDVISENPDLVICAAVRANSRKQYRQRTGGAVDELKVVVRDFDEDSGRSGYDRAGALGVMRKNPDRLVREQG